jgi:hypothetical protein
MLLNVGFLINIHWGNTRMPGSLRFCQTTLKSNSHKADVHINHDIKRMYGVSFGDGVFIGVLVCDKRKTTYTAVDPAKFL